MAQYRAGQYQAAAATLARADRLNQGTPADLAFQALARHQLGQKEQARATLARLRETLRQPRWTGDAEAGAFLREAEALFHGSQRAPEP